MRLKFSKPEKMKTLLRVLLDWEHLEGDKVSLEITRTSNDPKTSQKRKVTNNINGMLLAVVAVN